jgi:hypothetical protein
MITVEGTWNGSRVHFVVTSESLQGSLLVPLRRPAAGVPVSLGEQDFRSRDRMTAYCQYVLDRTNSDGTRTGMSICNGLPEDTVLEIPRVVQGWLTQQELVVVLLTLLSTPKLTSMEDAPTDMRDLRGGIESIN